LCGFGFAPHSTKFIEFETVAVETVSAHDVIRDSRTRAPQVIAHVIELIGGKCLDELVNLVLKTAGELIDG
jgi:hypothetical protein